jgi:hypothetical protein
MTSAPLNHSAARTGHTRLSDTVGPKARVGRPRITFAETPDLFLREEMS